MGYLTWWNFPRKAWLIIIGELIAITSLSAWLYATYLNDLYFQAYTNSLAPMLVPVLSVVFGIGSASLATYLYVGMKKIRTLQGSESHLKKKPPPKKTMQRPISPNESELERPALEKETPAKLRPLTPSHPAKQRKGSAKVPE